MLSTSEVKRQPHELIDCAAADRLIRTSVVVGSDLDVARVMGVLDATVSVPAAEPLLGRLSPVATVMMQSQALATLVIILQIVQQASDLAYTLPESSFSTITAFIASSNSVMAAKWRVLWPSYCHVVGGYAAVLLRTG